MKKKISLILTVIAFICFIVYVKINPEEFRILSNIKIYNLLLIVIFYFPTLILTSMYNKQILKKFRISIGIKEFFSLTVLSSFFNTLLPFRSGAGFRAVYLKKQHNLTYSKFTGSLAGSYILTFFISSITGIISLGFILFYYHTYELFSAIIFTVTAIVLGVLIFFKKFIFSHINYTDNKLLDNFMKALESWNLIRNDIPLIFYLITITIFNIFLSTLINFFSLKAVGVSISLIKILYLSSVSVFIGLINLTPGGIGVTEGIMIFVSRNLDISISNMLIMSLFSRSVTLFATLILTPFSILILFKMNRMDNIKKMLATDEE